MHSSRMRTGRSLSVFRGVYLVAGGVPGPRGVPGSGGCTWSQGVYLIPGVYLVLGGALGPRGVCLVLGVHLVPGGTPWDQVHPTPGTRYTPFQTRYTPPLCGQTDACKLITLAQLRCGR